MPLTKNANYRYRLIDQCLSAGRIWDLDHLQEYLSGKLIEEYGVKPKANGQALSARQLLADIAHMRREPPEGYAAPIVRKAGQVRYSDPAFTIQTQSLTASDQAVLREAMQLLRQFSVFPHYREIGALVERLGIRLEEAAEAGIQFEKNDHLTGLHFLEPLYYMIREKQPVWMVYQPFRQDAPLRTILHPWLLKEYNNRWFLLGWDQTDKDIRLYALDRLLSVEPSTGSTFRSPGFDPVSYFRDIIGVTLLKNEKAQDIVFEARGLQADYIRTKPLHPTQRLLKNLPDGAVFSCHLIPNYELESLLLSFGETVRVLQPESLRRKLHQRLQAALEGYEKAVATD